jgi:hypothetical protein
VRDAEEEGVLFGFVFSYLASAITSTSTKAQSAEERQKRRTAGHRVDINRQKKVY